MFYCTLQNFSPQRTLRRFLSSPTKFSNLQNLNTYKDLVPRSSLLPFTWRISKRPLWQGLATRTESWLLASYAALKLRSRRSTLPWVYFIFISITDINECDDGIHDCLRSLASCKNTLGSFNCSCNHGYIGDGKTYCIEAPGKITLCAFCFTEVAIGFVFL